MNNDIIDIFDDDLRKKPIDIILWWEKKRITYNIIVLISIWVVYLIESSLSNNSQYYWAGYFHDVFMCLILANLSYCVGWFFELVYYNYYDSFLTERESKSLFKLGLAFSVLCVFTLGLMSIIIFTK